MLEPLFAQSMPVLASMPVIWYPDKGSMADRFKPGPLRHQPLLPGVVQVVEPEIVAGESVVVVVVVVPVQPL
jgi:hypothetical protein